MERTSGNKVWIDGNSLVEGWGEQDANEELFGSGYQAKLTGFITKREAALIAEAAKIARINKKRNLTNAKKKNAGKKTEEELGL